MSSIEVHQRALDEQLVPVANRLPIKNSNFRLSDDYKESMDSIFHVALEIIRQSPFYNAFTITGSVSEIYMQEFWATASMNDNVMEFNIDNTPRFLELETFRDMFQVSIRTDDTEFAAPPSESETISFIKSIGYKGDLTRISHFEMCRFQYNSWFLHL